MLPRLWDTDSPSVAKGVTGSKSRTGVPALMPSNGTRHNFRSLAVVAGSAAAPVVGVPLITTGVMDSMPALVFWYRATTKSCRFWPCVPL